MAFPEPGAEARMTKGAMIHVPYAELARLAGDALRMHGLAVGHADDVAAGMLWTEAVLGRGYAASRQAEAIRPADGCWSRPSIEISGSIADVAFDGVPLLFYAARLSDFLASMLCGRDAAQLRAVGVVGGWTAPYMAHRLSACGFSAAVLWRGGDDADQDPAALAVVGPGAGGEIAILSQSPAFSGVPLDRGRGADIADAGIECFNPHLLAAVKTGLAVAVSTAPLPGTPGDAALRLADRIGFAFGQARSLVASRRIGEAVAGGLQVRAEDHGFLSKLARRRWVPTSERSRGQAG